jgi:hypothetical protein
MFENAAGALRDRSLSRARAIGLAALSLSFWSGVCLWRAPLHPWADLSHGIYTDHFSHVNAARVFPRIGIDLWRRPFDRLFRPLNRAELAALPADVATVAPWVYRVPGWPKDKPLAAHWTHIGRPYPPGDLVVVAPLAAAYHFTGLSFFTLNRLTILWFLALAHVSIYLLLRRALEEPSLARWGITVVCYFELVYWSLQGFYDGAAVTALIACMLFLERRRGVSALLAYCAATALHFRAFFLAPWALWSAWLAWRGRPWSRRERWALAAAAVLSAASLSTFVLVWPSIRSLPTHTGIDSDGAVLAFGVVVGVSAACLAWAEAWRDVVVLAWATFMFIFMRSLFAWYGLFLLPWLAAPGIGGRPREVAVAAGRFAAWAGFSFVAFNDRVIPGVTLVQSLFQ